MFGGTDGDGIDEGDGGIVEIEADSPRRKSSEIDDIKEGSTTPNFDLDLGDGDVDGYGDGDGDGNFDRKEGSIAPHFGDIDGKEGSKTPPYGSDGDGVGDGISSEPDGSVNEDGASDGNDDGVVEVIRRSGRQRGSPDRLTYKHLGELAWQWVFRQAHADLCNLSYELKRKRYPDGRIRKYKARLFVRGD